MLHTVRGVGYVLQGLTPETTRKGPGDLAGAFLVDR